VSSYEDEAILSLMPWQFRNLVIGIVNDHQERGSAGLLDSISHFHSILQFLLSLFYYIAARSILYTKSIASRVRYTYDRYITTDSMLLYITKSIAWYTSTTNSILYY